MSDGDYTFEQTKARLEEIFVQVRSKDCSLEQGMDLLEEGVRVLAVCNELIDQTSWRIPAPDDSDEGGEPGEDASAEAAGEPPEAVDETPPSAEAADGVAAEQDGLSEPPDGAAVEDDERD